MRHYELIIQKSIVLKGKLDGEDISEIAFLIDSLYCNDDNKHLPLVDELNEIANALKCEYGLDFGKTQNWESAVISIINGFIDGYEKNEQNLDKLLELIQNGIKQ